MMAAVTYFIAGKSNCPFFAKAQRIGEIISMNLPSVAVRIQPYHPSEWNTYLTNLCSRLDFKHTSSPIVYTQLGTLIGGSDQFLAMVRKVYGDIADFPSTILGDLANENFEISSKEMHKKEAIENHRLHEEQWDLRNERLKAINDKVVSALNQRLGAVGDLYQSCQHAKATLTVAPEKNPIQQAPKMLQMHLCSLSRSLPNVEVLQESNATLVSKADTLSSIPSFTKNGNTTHYSRSPDPIWRPMILVLMSEGLLCDSLFIYAQDNQRVMNEFATVLSRMHEANVLVQEEAAKAVAAATPLPPPTPVQPAAPPPPPIDIEKIPKSVSFAAIDTQYSPKNPSSYYSVPNTPKANEGSEPIVRNTLPPAPVIDPVPLQEAITALIVAVNEGIAILKNARKQLQIDIKTAQQHVSELRKVLSPDEYKPFRLRERKELSKNVHLFRIDLPSSTDVLGCPVGKHIIVKIGDIERSYSPITTDFDAGYFDLAIKVTRETPMMNFFTSVQADVFDGIQIKGPSGVEVFKGKEELNGICMFAHGVGITPMLQVIRHYLSLTDNTPLWLLYLANSEERLLLKDELERLSTQHTRFNLRYITSKPGNHWEYLQKECLAPSLPFRPAGFDFTAKQQPVKILVCGTINFAAKVKSLLHDLGHGDEHIHTF